MTFEPLCDCFKSRFYPKGRKENEKTAKSKHLKNEYDDV